MSPSLSVMMEAELAVAISWIVILFVFYWFSGSSQGGKRAHLGPYTKTLEHFAQPGSVGLFISHPRAFTKTIPFSKTNLSTLSKAPGTQKAKIPLFFPRHSATFSAMRQNPTAATGPVTIKHVRNTVPTPLPAPTPSK